MKTEFLKRKTGTKTVRKTGALLWIAVFCVAGVSGCGKNDVKITWTDTPSAEAEISAGLADASSAEPEISADMENAQEEPEKEPEDVPEWRQIYYAYLKDTDNLIAQNIMESEENARFFFCEWPGYETPVLGIESGEAFISLHYMFIKDKEVINFAHLSKYASGFGVVSLINDTDYYLIRSVATMTPWGDGAYDGALYDIHDTENAIWFVVWEDVSENSPEGDIQNVTEDEPYCTFRGEEFAKEEAEEKLDALLGDGAASQLMGIVGGDTSADGPLTFSDLIHEWNLEDVEMYGWERLEEVIE